MTKSTKTTSFKVGDQILGTVIEIFAATCNSDRCEGRGGRIDNSYHFSKREALVATKGIDVMGSDGAVEVRLAIMTDEKRFFLLPTEIEIMEDAGEIAKVRQEALAKLSPAERAALFGEA